MIYGYAWDTSSNLAFAISILPILGIGLVVTLKAAATGFAIAMTLGLMERWGAASSVAGDAITVPGGQRYRARNFTVEPDASSARCACIAPPIRNCSGARCCAPATWSLMARCAGAWSASPTNWSRDERPLIRNSQGTLKHGHQGN